MRVPSKTASVAAGTRWLWRDCAKPIFSIRTVSGSQGRALLWGGLRGYLLLTFWIATLPALYDNGAAIVSFLVYLPFSPLLVSKRSLDDLFHLDVVALYDSLTSPDTPRFLRCMKGPDEPGWRVCNLLRDVLGMSTRTCDFQVWLFCVCVI